MGRSLVTNQTQANVSTHELDRDDTEPQSGVITTSSSPKPSRNYFLFLGKVGTFAFQLQSFKEMTYTPETHNQQRNFAETRKHGMYP